MHVHAVIECNVQVFISYGDKSNDNLMLGHGFSEDDNPHDTFSIASLPRCLECN